VILPWFRKLREFTEVLALNLPYFRRPGIEVVLVLDENSDEGGVLELLGKHPDVRWKVIVNDQPHAWRPPCRAINVGIRHAEGEYLFVASPESAFVGDVPAQLLAVVQDFPGGVAVGRVAFDHFEAVRGMENLSPRFQACAAKGAGIHSFYGSVCGPRSAFEAVGAYDESFREWGGDDDNLRIRLEMAGYTILACTSVRLLHLSFERRAGGQHPQFPYSPELDRIKCSPASVVANPSSDWGRDFSRIAMATEGGASGATGASPLPATGERFVPQPGTVVPTGSRRRCRDCGRLLYYEVPTASCPSCRLSYAEQGVRHLLTRRRDLPYPRIACLMQVHNEREYLPGCLAHLRGHVDRVIALDDGSTDETHDILRSDPVFVDCLRNEPDPRHVWNERENRIRLMERARDLGFDWVLCCDADERFETAFLAGLRMIACSFPLSDVPRVAVDLRELWNSPDQYRIDGVWGNKQRMRFFRVPERIRYDLDQDLHGQWYPDHIAKYGRTVAVAANLYHLKMIRHEDRLRRRDLYQKLDPENRFQPMGYAYLAEEGPGMKLETIPAGREYDLGSLPARLGPG
jgi:GT2 family glycosyltransferase